MRGTALAIIVIAIAVAAGWKGSAVLVERERQSFCAAAALRSADRLDHCADYVDCRRARTVRALSCRNPAHCAV